MSWALSARTCICVFDTEHGLRLAMAGWLPITLEDELAVRVLHDEAKSAGNEVEWASERERLVELYTPQLTARERRLLAVHRVLVRLGFYRLTAAVHPVTGPVRQALARARPSP